MMKGRELAEELGIECQQALYSEWGNFYRAVTSFPAVLFDQYGFVLLESPEDLQRPGIQVGKRTNITGGIRTLPKYQRIAAWHVQLPEEVPDGAAFMEGAVETVTVNRHERNRNARDVCISAHGTACLLCGLRLSDLYGERAVGFVHVHHLIPVSTAVEEYELDPVRDLRPVCPNCHAIIHLRRTPYSLEEMKAMLRPQAERSR